MCESVVFLCMVFKLLCLQERSYTHTHRQTDGVIKTRYTKLSHIKWRQWAARGIKWFHSSWATRLMLEIQSLHLEGCSSFIPETLEGHAEVNIQQQRYSVLSVKTLHLPTGKHIACKCAVYSAYFSLHELIRASQRCEVIFCRNLCIFWLDFVVFLLI